jgi:hypothetical protein
VGIILASHKQKLLEESKQKEENKEIDNYVSCS